jgi:hypothetical protein
MRGKPTLDPWAGTPPAQGGARIEELHPRSRSPRRQPPRSTWPWPHTRRIRRAGRSALCAGDHRKSGNDCREQDREQSRSIFQGWREKCECGVRWRRRSAVCCASGCWRYEQEDTVQYDASSAACCHDLDEPRASPAHRAGERDAVHEPYGRDRTACRARAARERVPTGGCDAGRRIGTSPVPADLRLRHSGLQRFSGASGREHQRTGSSTAGWQR